MSRPSSAQRWIDDRRHCTVVQRTYSLDMLQTCPCAVSSQMLPHLTAMARSSSALMPCNLKSTAEDILALEFVTRSTAALIVTVQTAATV